MQEAECFEIVRRGGVVSEIIHPRVLTSVNYSTGPVIFSWLRERAHVRNSHAPFKVIILIIRSVQCIPIIGFGWGCYSTSLA